jgi:eukaryotic-like serine/threonine-protein kinase
VQIAVFCEKDNTCLDSFAEAERQMELRHTRVTKQSGVDRVHLQSAWRARRRSQSEHEELRDLHRDTLLSMGNLAATYAREGKDEQAEALFDQTLEVSRRVLGPEHTTTLGFLADRALLYLKEGKLEKAEADATQVLAGRRRVGGSEAPSDVHLAAADLAMILVAEGKFEASEPIARENLEFNVRERPESWQRFRAESLLGAALAGEKKYAEAEPLLAGGYQGMLARKEKMGVPDLYHLDRAREWLAELETSKGSQAGSR